MGVISRPARARRTHPVLFTCVLAAVALSLWCARFIFNDAWTLAALPVVWSHNSEKFLLSAESDGFDITFANYSAHQTSAGAPYDDRVPPTLHHISLGSGAAEHSKWAEVRQSCVDIHPGWEAMLWTDETAGAFVAEHFPELKEMWDSYRYPIQRIDSLRYMVLYHYGGVILDMDLQCRRAFGPLRRFEFVAPAAHPQGFSIGFMMAAKGNRFVGELVRNLREYNRHWLFLPYPTVMFSTGCHYASTIHSLQPNRVDLKILGGTKENPNLHRLNGRVSTPIFEHLGSSSWHSYDAAIIYNLGKSGSKWQVPVLAVCGVIVASVVVRRLRRRRRLVLRA
ncbi:glycosyltransferase family 32 protein [Apodospora peruviana]|uniref:Glycosyltransferase family 32 protein n=1 Tax=Apodospora peruviana TaxID=516989 RepID=A0AAE0M7T5_9PEZI|nr:glycosyltransferase family 32 protein [Apodospora peruviana]